MVDETPKVLSGVVKWFSDDKGYGFIVRDDGEGDVFCHWRQIDPQAGPGYRTLSEGQRVTFTIGEGPKGDQAENVTAVP